MADTKMLRTKFGILKACVHLVTIHKNSKKFIGTIMIHYIDTRLGCACERLSPRRLRSWKFMTSYQTNKFENRLWCTVTCSYDIRSHMTREVHKRKLIVHIGSDIFYPPSVYPSLKRRKLSHLE